MSDAESRKDAAMALTSSEWMEDCKRRYAKAYRLWRKTADDSVAAQNVEYAAHAEMMERKREYEAAKSSIGAHQRPANQ